MVASVLPCLIFLLLLPCFSNSCPQTLPCDNCPQTLPCDNSIKVRPPFIFTNPDDPYDPSCEGYLKLGCDKRNPFLLWDNHSFPLENISYDTYTITIQDPYLGSSLKESGCGNLYYNFSTPVNISHYEMYDSLNSSLSSMRCHPPNHIQLLLPETFGEDYNISYSPSSDEVPHHCRRHDDFGPIFELILSFEEDTPELSLKSASYSSDLAATPECFANLTQVPNCDECKGKTSQAKKRNLIVIVVGCLTLIIAGLILIFLLRCCKGNAECILLSKYKPQENIEMLIEKYGSFAPKGYEYGELKKITHSFQETLGKGGFGNVYKGKLSDGRLVAVKILHSSTSQGEEFLNEVLSIGRTSHVNVVSLLGFCHERSKHALIYEYMPNGSLDKYIYCENPKEILGWEKLYEIAIGIARGLEYLHRGCNARIVHFDIKPQNILLDEDFNPKIADFGLAKLCPQKESIISMADMRGTVGYIAPEVFSRSFGVVSTKSDVYSYGMMVLEMVGGRRNAKPSAENPSRVYFPHWLYDRLAEGCKTQSCDGLIANEEIAKKMGMVGLWCTQTIPANRPSMSRVVEMLEKGLDELDMPPKPFSASPPHFIMSSADICST